MAVDQADSPESRDNSDSTPLIPHRWVVGGGVGAALTLLLWFSQLEVPRPRPLNTSEQLVADPLKMAIDALESVPEIGLDEGRTRGIAYLNTWIERKDTKPAAWKPDPLLDRLPRVFRDPDAPQVAQLAGLSTLDQKTFTIGDFAYLRECLWMKDIARRIGSETPPDSLQPWLDEIQQEQGEVASRKLATAERLFDWTIRNVQLEPLLPPAPEPEAAVGDSPDARFRRLPSPAKGIPGPGYKFAPWQTLLFGAGDAWERDRVFLYLCRQAGIEVVMLAIDGDNRGGPTPWLAAAFINDKLYLFDGELGLPIPGPNDKGIATLDQVAADPSLLRKLDIAGGDAYRLASDDMKKVVALVDACPESLAQRMATLQKGLVGERRLQVAVSPSELAAALKPIKQLNFVALWRIPFDAALYGPASAALAQRDPAKYQEFFIKYRMFAEHEAVMKGRQFHLKGQFNSADGKRPGAREWYERSRRPDSDIIHIRDSEAAQAQIVLQMKRAGQPVPDDKKQRAEMFRQMALAAFREKQNASYFLGLIAYDAGDYPLAADWFKTRILEGDPNTPWIPAARYNLGRSLEAQGQWRAAAELYQLDDSPQRHGNLLRARRLLEEQQK